MALHITSHAISRYRERVAPVSYDDALAALTCAAVELAAEIGAPFVKLGTGQRIVLVENRVVTVLPCGTWAGCLCTEMSRKHDLPQGEVQ